MRLPLLGYAAVSALGLAASLIPSGAKAGDNQHLPCNEYCRDWMGTAYTGDDRSGPGFGIGPVPVGPVGQPTESESNEDEPPMRTTRHVVHHDHLFRPRQQTPAFIASEPGMDRHPSIVLERDRSPHKQPRAVASVREPEAHRVSTSPAKVTGPSPDKQSIAKLNLPNTESVAPPAQKQAADTPEKLAIELDNDAHTVTLSLPDNPSEHIQLTAGQVDSLIQKFGTTRSQMQPQPQPNWSFGQSVVSIYDPRWTTEAERRKGDTLLHIRDPRFGWLHYTIPRMTAQQLGGLLTRQAAIAAPPGRRAEATSP